MLFNRHQPDPAGAADHLSEALPARAEGEATALHQTALEGYGRAKQYAAQAAINALATRRSATSYTGRWPAESQRLRLLDLQAGEAAAVCAVCAADAEPNGITASNSGRLLCANEVGASVIRCLGELMKTECIRQDAERIVALAHARGDA